MHIGPLGLPEIIIILVVVLIIFGPKNLPKLGKAVGRTVKNLREGIDGGKEDEETTEAEAEPAQKSDTETVVETVEADVEKKA